MRHAGVSTSRTRLRRTGPSAKSSRKRTPSPEDDRHEVEVQLVEQSGRERLAGEVAAHDAHVASPAASLARAIARSSPSVTNTNGSSSASSGGWCVTTKNGQSNGGVPPQPPAVS
jgi:hypothetical protein